MEKASRKATHEARKSFFERVSAWAVTAFQAGIVDSTSTIRSTLFLWVSIKVMQRPVKAREASSILAPTANFGPTPGVR